MRTRIRPHARGDTMHIPADREPASSAAPCATPTGRQGHRVTGVEPPARARGTRCVQGARGVARLTDIAPMRRTRTR